MLIRNCLLFSLLIAFASMCQGQDTDGIVNWITKNLSVKSDEGFTRFGQVADTIRRMDSTRRCEVFQKLDDKESSANTRFRIRYLLIKASFAISAFDCPTLGDGLANAKKALQLSYEIEDPLLITMSNNRIASQYIKLNEHGLAVMHLRIAVESQDDLANNQFNSAVMDYHTLGLELYHTRQYRESIDAFQRALQLNARLKVMGDNEGGYINLMFLYNTLALAYQKIGQYDSAFVAFNKALEYAQKNKAEEWIGLIKGNIGDIYYLQGNYDSARVYLEKDLEISLAAGKNWVDNAANTMQWLARIDSKRGDHNKALHRLYDANKILKEHYNPTYQANIYYAFIEVFKELRNTDSMYAYMQKYQVLHDSLEQKASDDRAEIVQVRLENQEGIHEIMSLNKDKRRIALIRNFVIALTLLGAVIGFLYLNRQRLKNQLRERQMLDEKNKAEAEAADAKKQLTFFTQHLIEKNTLVEKLQEQLTQKALDEEQIQAISQLSHHTILTDEDWDRFRSLFEKVYPGFFHQLKTKTPDITLAEQRMAALTKLHISAKEASHLLGISPSSVNKTRQRLKTRLGLENDADLDTYFA